MDKLDNEPIYEDTIPFCARHELKELLYSQSKAPRWYFTLFEDDGATKATLSSLLRLSYKESIYFLNLAQLIFYQNGKWNVCDTVRPKRQKTEKCTTPFLHYSMKFF